MANLSISRELTVTDLGLIDYKKAWDLQLDLHEKRRLNEIKDILLICEHPHTYTLGKIASKENLLFSEKELSEKKINVFEIDRGGDITYHGPGQIVGYAVLNLEDWRKDTHLYLRSLEEVLIRTCAYFGLAADRNKEYTGVWVGDRKICAIGIKVSRWITMHGFAFNVNSDLELFKGIIPCGIQDKAVTSLSEEKKEEMEIGCVKDEVVRNFKEVFQYDLITIKTVEELKKKF